MVLSMGDSKATTSDDDDEDENYEEKSKENLIKILIRQRRKLNEKDEIIEDLKADLKREKKLNDMMMDQAAYIRSLRRQVDTAVKGQSTKCKDASVVHDVQDVDFSTPVPFSQPITPYQPPPTRRNSVKSDGSVESKTPESHDDTHSEAGNGDDEGEDSRSKYAPLHERCTKPAGVFGYMLNAFKNLPHNRTTLLIGDSNFHGIKHELDPIRRSTAVRSISGLCINGAAETLKNYKHQYPNIKKLVFSLGVNDHLHVKQHCESDWKYHFTNLIHESKRVFCSATIHFIVPFKGLPRVPSQHIEKIWDFLMNEFPDVRKHRAPSMEGKVQERDGIHLTSEGYETLRDFLVKRFTPRKKYKPNGNRQTAALSGRSDVSRGENHTSYRVERDPGNVHEYQYSRPPHSQYNQHSRGWEQPRDLISQFPSLRDELPNNASQRIVSNQHDESLRGLSEALASLMHKHLYKLY